MCAYYFGSAYTPQQYGGQGYGYGYGYGPTTFAGFGEGVQPGYGYAYQEGGAPPPGQNGVYPPGGPPLPEGGAPYQGGVYPPGSYTDANGVVYHEQLFPANGQPPNGELPFHHVGYDGSYPPPRGKGGRGRGSFKGGGRGESSNGRPGVGRTWGVIDPETGHDYERLKTQSTETSTVDESLVHAILAQRLQHKMARNFEEADRLRDELTTLGVMVHDREKTWEVRRVTPPPMTLTPPFYPPPPSTAHPDDNVELNLEALEIADDDGEDGHAHVVGASETELDPLPERARPAETTDATTPEEEAEPDA